MKRAAKDVRVRNGAQADALLRETLHEAPRRQLVVLPLVVNAAYDNRHSLIHDAPGIAQQLLRRARTAQGIGTVWYGASGLRSWRRLARDKLCPPLRDAVGGKWTLFSLGNKNRGTVRPQRPRDIHGGGQMRSAGGGVQLLCKLQEGAQGRRLAAANGGLGQERKTV